MQYFLPVQLRTRIGFGVIHAIQRNEKASFCVIDQDKIVPDEYTSYFRSVIAFGRVEVIEDEEEKRAAIEKLAVKYVP